MTPDTTAASDAQHGVPWHSSVLAAAVSGLQYTSEGDAPFDEVFIPGGAATWPLGVEEFAVLVGAPAGATVREQTLDKFMARHIERADPQDALMQAVRPRFEALRDTLRATLRDVRVFRVGEVSIRCYVVGADTAGNLAGVATTSFET